MQLSNEIKVVKTRAYNDNAGTTNVNGTDIDFTGYDGVCFFGEMEKATASTDVNKITVSQKNAAGSYAALAGASATCTEDGQVLMVDVYKPNQSLGKILRVTVDIATTTKYGDIYAVLYKGRKHPETAADVVARVVSPAAVA